MREQASNTKSKTQKNNWPVGIHFYNIKTAFKIDVWLPRIFLLPYIINSNSLFYFYFIIAKETKKKRFAYIKRKQ